MRTKREDYLKAKYVVAFLSGGIAVLVPLIFNLMCSLVLLPNLAPLSTMGEVTVGVAVTRLERQTASTLRMSYDIYNVFSGTSISDGRNLGLCLFVCKFFVRL